MGDWNPAKRKRKTLEIVWNPECELLKVQKIAGKHLESMGVPGKSGYQLFAEEAVYLMETGSATIATSSGAELSILEAFAILESRKIDNFKYEVYKQVKRTGLVVLRPRKSTIDAEKIHQARKAAEQKIRVENFQLLTELHHFPENRPDADFPTYSGRNRIKMKALHNDPKLVNFLQIPDFPTLQALKKIPEPSRSCRTACRPVHWPFYPKNVQNWTEFRFETAKMRNSALMNRFRRLKMPNSEQLRREKATLEHVDFHVFSPAGFSHRLPARPLFSIVCVRATSNRRLSVAELSRLENVVLAVEESGKVAFLSISGGPIDLNAFLTSTE